MDADLFSSAGSSMHALHGLLPYPPHGACWVWDWKLLVLHAPAELATWFYYSLIPLIAIHIYRRGRLARLKAAYPRLWTRGAAFVTLCGLVHLGGFVEIWIGGWVYYATGSAKIAMAVSAHLFAREFWRVRDELVLIGQLLQAALRAEREDCA